MTEELLAEFETNIASWKLVPSRGGVFEFSLNGELLFSKKKLGRHAEIDEIRKLLKDNLKRTPPDLKLL
jgi:selenoprotein W-related protein